MESAGTQVQDEEVHPSAYAQLRHIIRQNSEKVGWIAEDVVLPINKRSIKRRAIDIEAVDLQQHAPAFETQQAENAYAPVYAATVSKPFVERFRPEKEFPIFMILISALQVGLFYSLGDQFLLLIFGYDPSRRYELWRYITVMLAHASVSHLWGNVIFQLILGVLLELVHHWKRIAIIYLASVIGGSLFITALTPTSYGVGASAGVYGLLFSHLSTIILNWNQMDRKCCRLFWLLLYIGQDIALNVFLELGLKKGTNTSHAGHVGGAITGFLVSILVLKNFEIKAWEKKMQQICAGILVLLFVVIVLINIAFSFFSFYYLESQFNFEYGRTYIMYVLKTLKDLPKDSDTRVQCELDQECKSIFDQYLYNGTVPEDF